MGDSPAVAGYSRMRGSRGEFGSYGLSVAMLLVWIGAGVIAFLPFALNTSPWDAVRLHVPGNQGNWWHALVGAPFFLAYPMIWLRFKTLLAARPLSPTGRRFLWGVVGLSIIATVSVETPFLLHLAGTSEWQRLSVLSLGFGIVLLSAVLLFLRRDRFSHPLACMLGLITAYLSNLALCLVVYSGAAGNAWSKSGWIASMVIVWIIIFEMGRLFVLLFRS